tara:strand:- start:450 stop:920 length:471 start_codon:yes stop_codon:yes gene_type:complete
MAERKIAGTNQVYTGMVVKLGEFEYTTVGGGIEGDRQQLEPINTTLNSSSPSETLNDVVTPFVVGDGSMFGNGTYFYSNGTQVPTGTELHHHTIVPQGRTSNFMTQHVMDGNDVDVFTNIGGQANNQNTNQQNQQNGMNGNGGNGGNGGMGGGGSY